MFELLFYLIAILFPVWLIGAVVTTREDREAYRFGWDWPKRLALRLIDRVYHNRKAGGD